MSLGNEDPRALQREIRRLRYELSQALATLPQLRRLVESSGDGLLLVDDQLRVLLGNSPLAAMLAVPAEAVQRQPLSRWLAIPQQEQVLRQRLQELAVGASLRMELTLRPQAGEPLAVELEASRLAAAGSADGEACFSLALRDISERQRLASSQAMLDVQQQLLHDLGRSEERHRLLVEQLEDGLGLLDPGLRLVVANPALRRLLGLPDGALPSPRLAELLLPAERPSFDQLAGALLSGQPRRCRLRVAAAHAGSSLLELRFLPRSDRHGRHRGFTLMARDVTALQQAHDRLERLAFSDALTGLGNAESSRRWLQEKLSQLPAGRTLAVLCLDLDGFRRVNHCFGRASGDLLLQQVADTLRRVCRPGDALARLAGDEFLVIRSEADRPAAEALARSLQQALLQGSTLPNGERLGLGCCAGISLCPDHGREADSLLRQAATALSRAHAAGRGQVVVYEPAQTTSLLEELALERRLRRAIEAGRLQLAYQPQVDCRGRLLGCEALLRWHDPEQGAISPLQFIPVAERSGLIHDLGLWVLEQVCAQQSRWLRAGIRLRPMAVNVSPLQLLVRPALSELVAEALHRHDLPARWLELEITESSMLPITAVVDQLEALAALGISLALDDFGTGFSSLESLHRLPLHRVKIDKSFVLPLETSASARVIVRTAVAMARGLGLGCVVEGVETAAQLERLRRMHCHIFQGFLLARPMPLEDYEAVLRRGRIDG